MKPIVINSNIPDELLKDGYWFKFGYNNTFIITLNISDNIVTAVSYLADDSVIDLEPEAYLNMKNGTKVKFFQCVSDTNWLIKMDVFPKYYFPKFNPDNSQWYHKDTDRDDLNDFTELLKATYELAIKEGGIERL